MGDMLILIINPPPPPPLTKFDVFRLKLAKVPITQYYNDYKRLNCNLRYFDDVIISSKRETQMGDQVISLVTS